MRLVIDFITGIDEKIAVFFNEYLTNSFVQWFFNFFTIIGSAAAVWLLIFLIFSIYKKDKWTWLFWIIPFIAVFFIVELGLKNIIGRERPYIVLEGIKMLTYKPDSFSFPSSHGAFSAAAVVIAAKIKSPPGIVWYIILSVLITVSRIVLKAHFLSDIICGYAVGWVIAYTVIKILEKVRSKSGINVISDKRS